MGANVLVDAGFLVALLSQRDANHRWATDLAPRLALPWKSCEAAVTETFHLLGTRGSPALAAALEGRLVICDFDLNREVDYVLKLMQKYVDVPMSFADACLVRMTETLSDPILYTTDTDFRIYRRHGRQAIPCMMPG
jgi:uncharacterized protein